jgi:hypothetical protein
MAAIRRSSWCIAAATCISVVGICTALFFSTWRLAIDAHQYFFGTPMSQPGGLAFAYIAVFGVLPIMIAVLGLCLDRCVAWWQGVLTFFVALSATFYFIVSPTLRFLLPVGLLGEGTNSSQRCYLGAILQLAVAWFLLRHFRRAPRFRARDTVGLDP